MQDNSESLKTWLTENLTEQQIKEMFTLGIDAGWAGLAQYSDLSDLYQRFKNEIWETLVEDAETLGYPNPLAMITATFDQKVLDEIRSAEQFQNRLFWYLVKRTLMKMAN